MYCIACGAKLVEGARFCSRCGTPTAADEAPEPPAPRPPEPGEDAATRLDAAKEQRPEVERDARTEPLPRQREPEPVVEDDHVSPPAVLVTAPTGGKTWRPGEALEIAWVASAGVGASLTAIDLALYRGLSREAVIVPESAPLPGTARSHTWTVPEGLAAGDDYRVRVVVRDSRGQTTNALSPVPFAIALPLRAERPTGDEPAEDADRLRGGGEAPQVRVLLPAAGDVWQAGTPHEVVWEAAAPAGSSLDQFELVLYRGETPLYSIVAPQAVLGGQTRRYTWTIPRDLEPGGDYRVRAVARDTRGRVSHAFSAGGLTITAAPPLSFWERFPPKVAAAIAVPVALLGLTVWLGGPIWDRLNFDPTSTPLPTRAAITPTVPGFTGGGSPTPTVRTTVSPSPGSSSAVISGSPTATGFSFSSLFGSPTPTSSISSLLSTIAANAGQASPTASRTPAPPTATPRPTFPAITVSASPSPAPATFGTIRFGTGVSGSQLTGEATTFTYGVKEVYAFWSFSNLRDGTPWGRVWWRDGVVDLDRRSDSTWDRGSSGTISWRYFNDDNPLDRGSYQLALFIDGREVQRSVFTIR